MSGAASTKQEDIYDIVNKDLIGFLEKGDDGSGLPGLKKDDARRVSAAMMLTIMGRASLSWCIMKRVTLETQIRPSVTAKVEFSGPVTVTDIDRLKKHLDLMAETLPPK